jgi:hypothetical protein
MNRRIPESIVLVVEELASSLAQWCGEGRGRSLAEHEAAVLARVRGVLGKLLGAVLAETTSGLDRRARWGKTACPGCARATAPGRWRERTLATRCGTVTLPTVRYQCGGCHRGWGGLETTLGVAARARMSVGLEAWVARLGGLTDFREATELLAEYTGIALGAETARRHSERVGTVLADAEDAALLAVERTREAAGPVDPAPGLLVVELDGVMARYLDGWHEVKIGAVGGVVDRTTTALSYVAAREGPDRFGLRLVAEAARRGALDIVGWDGPLRGRGLARLRRVLVLGDGARWIWALAAEHFGDRVEIVDFYHASQHLWEVARALFPDDPAAQAAWARPLSRRLRDEGITPILDVLATVTAPTGTPAADVLRRERAFVRTNADRMAYPAFTAQGFPIGSGAVESAARHVIQLRMKRPGMRWSDAGGRAISSLRATVRSQRSLVA